MVTRSNSVAAATAAAKSSTDEASSTSPIVGSIVWEYEQKKNVWLRYDDQCNQLINAAQTKHTDSNTPFNVTLPQIGQLQITFSASEQSQKNAATGFKRALRLACSSADGHFYVWQWEEKERKRWQCFLADALVDLEKSFVAGQQSHKLSVANGKITYSLDLKAMTQTNDKTNMKRNIRREKSEAVVSVAQARATAKRAATDTGSIAGAPAAKMSAPAAESKAKSATKSAKPESKSASSAGTSKSTMKSTKRTVLVKGRAAVDPDCSLHNSHVYEHGNDIYDAHLNQTNVANNNNKYYIIQLLETDVGKSYHVWFRWGRVGYKGQTSLTACGADLERAKRTFCDKFYDKTRNEWAGRKQFEKVDGKYDLVEVDHGAGDQPQTEAPEEQSKDEQNSVACKLEASLQTLMKLICDVKAMRQAVLELEYDADRAPLGKLTKQQINNGYKALQTIEVLIGKKDYGRKLVDACNDYYTRVPHYFGMRQPPLIKDGKALRLELQLLEALTDIEVAIRTINSPEAQHKDLHPLDNQYNALHCNMHVLHNTHADYKLIESALTNTHGPTHLTYKMQLQQVYTVDKTGHAFDQTAGNRMLLWHGSRLTNWYGILSRGLQIAPPEAPVTGYMFGKGLYFADVASKSANYCFATDQKNVGILLLCEVALGKTRDLLAADYKADKLPAGYDSTKGLGQMQPDPKHNQTLLASVNDFAAI